MKSKNRCSPNKKQAAKMINNTAWTQQQEKAYTLNLQRLQLLVRVYVFTSTFIHVCIMLGSCCPFYMSKREIVLQVFEKDPAAEDCRVLPLLAWHTK
jgi:hypothetical protein